jgi:hypothetical protein
MTLEVFLIGGAAVLIGLAFTAAGFPLFLGLLPIWAFLTGFLAGASAVVNLDPGTSLISSAVGIGVGIFVGALVAVVSLAFWWAGIIVLGITLGYSLGAGVMDALGFGPGLITLVVSMTTAAIVGVAFFVLRMPRVFVIVLTAIGGAALTVAGAMLLLDQVELARFAAGPIGVLRTAGPVAIIAAIALAVVGIIIQMRLAVNTEVRLWRDATGESV